MTWPTKWQIQRQWHWQRQRYFENSLKEQSWKLVTIKTLITFLTIENNNLNILCHICNFCDVWSNIMVPTSIQWKYFSDRHISHKNNNIAILCRVIKVAANILNYFFHYPCSYLITDTTSENCLICRGKCRHKSCRRINYKYMQSWVSILSPSC